MTHSIVTSSVGAALQQADVTPTGNNDVPVTGTLWRDPVLVVRDQQTENEIGKPVREVSLLFREDRLVVNPWSTERCDIAGEDLFALRELLAELPESAFKRPKDPVVESFCFLDGVGEFWAYSASNDSWHVVGNSPGLDSRRMNREHSSAYGGFDAWEEAVASYDIVDDGVRAWEAGDIVHEVWADGEDILGRDVEGYWASIKGTSSILHQDDAIDHFLEEGRFDGLYSYTVIRRGGVFV